MANMYATNNNTRALFLQFMDDDNNIHYMVNDKEVTKDEGNALFLDMKNAGRLHCIKLQSEDDMSQLIYDLSGEYQSLAQLASRGDTPMSEQAIKNSSKELDICSHIMNILKRVLNHTMSVNNQQLHTVFPDSNN